MRVGGLAAFVSVVTLTACSGSSTASTTSAAQSALYGGTVRAVDTAGPGAPDPTTLDPSMLGYDQGAFELIRCCLARSLLSYSGQPTGKGGSDPKPDLATAMPDVSEDGLKWTFHIRPGVHYSPPLQATEVTAGDFVRSLERLARVGGPGGGSNAGIFSIIRGYADYVAGRASSVVGLETPDPHTLVVRLGAPEGDLAYIVASQFLIPIPPLPGDPTAAYGVATGHDAGVSGFLVSSGPYMIDGSDRLDFSAAPSKQTPVKGLVTGKSLTLVRNPSWRSADDSLHPAYADRILVTWATGADAAAAIDRGDADLALPACAGAPCLPPTDQIQAYEGAPSRGRVDVEHVGAEMYLGLNVAVPPFDDVHVRRAIAYALDRQAMLAIFGGNLHGSLAGHVADDSTEDNALLSFDPFRTADAASRIAAAKREMAMSRYDPDHDGICDGPVCRDIGALGDGPPGSPRAQLEGTVAPALSAIGLGVDMQIVTPDDFFAKTGDPKSRTAVAAGWIFGLGYGGAYYVFDNLFGSDAVSGGMSAVSVYTMVGASADQLRSWGYPVTSVPNIDDRIAQCKPLTGAAAIHCWTALDVYVTEDVVADIPLIVSNVDQVIPARVVNYSWDGGITEPALDSVAVRH